MKSSIFKIIFALLFGLALSSCSILAPYEAPLTQGTIVDQESLDTLQEGLSKDQVRTLLGPPLGTNLYNPNHWEYVFYTTDESLHPEAAGHVIVRFDQDAFLASWEVFKQSGVKLDESRWYHIF